MAEETITNAFIKFRLPGTLPNPLTCIPEEAFCADRTTDTIIFYLPDHTPFYYQSTLTYQVSVTSGAHAGDVFYLSNNPDNGVERGRATREYIFYISTTVPDITGESLLISWTVSGGSDTTLIEYPFAIEPSSYVKRDLVDFAPRAGGGDVAYSNLDLYQIVTQDSWHHGFGFTQFRDKFGHRITSDGVDTRNIGMAMLFTSKVAAYQDATGGMKSCLNFQGETYFNFGTGGVWKRSVSNNYDKVLSGTVNDLISNGSYLIATLSSARMKTSANGTVWVDAGVSGNPPYNLNRLAIHNGFMWGSESATDNSMLNGTTSGNGLPRTFTSGTGEELVCTGSMFLSQVSKGDIVLLGSTVSMRVNQVISNTILVGDVIVGGTVSVGMALYKQTSGSFYDCLHFWSMADSADAEGHGVADSAAITVGSGSPGIVAIASFNGALHAARPDGVWAVDDTVVPPVARKVLDFQDEQDASNFKVFVSWRGRLYFNIKNMLYAYNGASLANVTPPTYSLDFPPLGFGGYIGSAYRGAYLYVIALNNESPASYKLLAFDGTGWFSLMNIGTTAPSGVSFSPLLNKIFYGLTGGALFSIRMQATTELPYAEFPHIGSNYERDHYLNLSELDFGFRRVKKSFAEMDIEVYNVAAGRYVALDYSADGGPWYRLGYTTQSGVTQFNMSPTVQANKLDVRLDFQTSDIDQSPILRNFTLKAMVRPDVLYGHQMMVLGADQIQMLDGMQHTLSSEEQKNILETIRDSKAPVLYVDPFGIEHEAYISSCTFRNLQRRPGEKRSNFTAIINIVEVR